VAAEVVEAAEQPDLLGPERNDPDGPPRLSGTHDPVRGSV
jgi:hypothetical protein